MRRLLSFFFECLITRTLWAARRGILAPCVTGSGAAQR
jgi:hypothetical protein